MTDWSIVGYSTDPIPDDPDTVAAQIDHINGVAANIRAQVERLPSSGDVEALRWNDNPAASSFKECCAKLPTDLNELNTRYTAVGGALTTFNATLRSTKAAALAAQARAASAHGAMVTASAGVTQMNEFKSQAAQQAATQNRNASAGTPPVTPASWTGPDYSSQLSSSTTDFNTAKTAVDTAVNQFHHACITAEAAVNSAIHDGLKNHTGFWHWVGNLVGSAAHAVASHLPLKAIASVCGQLAGIAALLSFIPVVGQVADVVALSLGAVALTAQAISAVNDAYEGTFTWSGDGLALALDATCLIPGASEAEDAGEGVRVADSMSQDTRELDHGVSGNGDGGGGGGAGGGPPVDQVMAHITTHTETALQEFEDGTIQLTPRQQDAVDAGRLPENTPKGQVLDKRIKQLVEDDPYLKDRSVTVTPQGLKGPDFLNPSPLPHETDWYDVTTSGSWPDHLRKYTGINGRAPTVGQYGSGSPILWDDLQAKMGI